MRLVTLYNPTELGVLQMKMVLTPKQDLTAGTLTSECKSGIILLETGDNWVQGNGYEGEQSQASDV